MFKSACVAISLFVCSFSLRAQVDSLFKSYQQSIPGTKLNFQLVPVPAGHFTMGSHDDPLADADEIPAHDVNINPFWMGAFEVSYEEYDAFMQDESVPQNSDADAITRPSQPYIDMTLGMGRTGGYPANSMQQYGALMYCRWLYQKTGIFFRLPTEAEWEYACRAGATTSFPFGKDSKELEKYAWFKNNSEDKYHKAGELQPNAWGLYDMLGNVAEWTLDQYDEKAYRKISNPADNPVIKPTARHPRTVRGGSYKDEAKELRPGNRIKSDPVWNRRDPQEPKSKWWNADAPFVGFRITRPLKQPSAEEVNAFFQLYLGR